MYTSLQASSYLEKYSCLCARPRDSGPQPLETVQLARTGRAQEEISLCFPDYYRIWRGSESHVRLRPQLGTRDPKGSQWASFSPADARVIFSVGHATERPYGLWVYIYGRATFETASAVLTSASTYQPMRRRGRRPQAITYHSHTRLVAPHIYTHSSRC